MTVMIEGRLRWSQSTEFVEHLGHRPVGGSWYVWSIDDQLCYHARRENGGWAASAWTRFVGTIIDLGWHVYLKDAKHAVDAHHHARILASDSWANRAYIRRFPLS